MNGKTSIDFEEGSGNVFADLGLPDADAQLAGEARVSRL